jgi:PRC-barrel domain
MEERGVQRIESGMEVYDRDGHKLGTVAHVHELDAPGPRGYLEVATGLLSRLGLGRRLFVPLEAIRDVTEGGVFLTAGRAEADRADWHTRPAALAPRAAPPAAPGGAAAPAADAQTVLALADWAAAAPHYRRRWEEQHGAGGRWEAYEPRYRFAWEMARLPAYTGQPWPRVRPELGARWEVQHPEVDWDTVADAVRDAWEHVAGAAGVSPSSA